MEEQPKQRKLKSSVVNEVPWGMYVFATGANELLGNENGDVANVFVWEAKDRPAAKKALEDFAKRAGVEGKAVWWGGVRPIDDNELERQTERAMMGLTPDPLDIAAFNDDIKELRQDYRGY